jgi:hypothetical protein
MPWNVDTSNMKYEAPLRPEDERGVAAFVSMLSESDDPLLACERAAWCDLVERRSDGRCVARISPRVTVRFEVDAPARTVRVENVSRVGAEYGP